MNTCPLCNSKVLYLGFQNLECSGRGCQNFRGEPEPDKLTRKYLLGFFGKVSTKLQVAWRTEDMSVYGGTEEYLSFHGFQEYPLTFMVKGSGVADVQSFRVWVLGTFPAWAECL